MGASPRGRSAGSVGERFTYADAVDALSSASVFGINPSLDGITAMCEALDRPQDAFASVQVTGTNGKSSTARITATLLTAHGLRTGLYTSPELHSYTERIEVDGSPLAEDEFAAAVREALVAAARADLEPTEFEILTAAALWAFRERAVDFAVLEVGMGGRWDATSVVKPSVAVITGVGLDHTAHLGPTREEIARDKAQIIRAASAPVLGPGTVGVEAVFLERAEMVDTHARAVRSFGTDTPVAEELTVRFEIRSSPRSPDGVTVLDVRGTHAEYPALSVTAPAYQAANVATAVAAAEAALGRPLALTPAPSPPDTQSAREAIVRLDFPGRFEVVSRDPWVVVDGAHNPEAAGVLASAVADAWPDPASRPVVVLGVLADKDAEGIAASLAPVAGGFVCVTPDSPRALPAAELTRAVERATGALPSTARSVEEGVTAARALAHTDLLVTGSIRTAAEARILFAEEHDTRRESGG